MVAKAKAKPRAKAKAKPKEKWIQKGKEKGTIRKGGLHRTLGKSEDEPITKADIARAQKMGGKAAKQAALALTFKKMNRKRTKKGGR